MAAVATPGKPGRVQHGLRAERRSEAVAGYLFIAVPMVLFLVLNIGLDLLRRCTSASGTGTSATGPVELPRARQLPVAARRPDLPDGRPEHPLLRGRVGAADDGARPVPGGRSSTRRSAARRSSGPRSTSRRSRARPRSRSCGSSSSPPTACSTASGRRWASTRSSSSSGSRPTRTGSATRARRSTSVILLNAWTTSGTFMLFYLASLQSISRTRSTRPRRSTAPAGGRRSGGSRSRCCAPATSSWPRWRSSARSSCSTRRSSAGGPERRPEQRPDDDRAVPLQRGLQAVRLQLRGGRRDRPVRDHLLGDARPAPAVRPGARRGEATADDPADAHAGRHRASGRCARRRSPTSPGGGPRCPAPPHRLRAAHRLRDADVRPVRLVGVTSFKTLPDVGAS